MDNPKHFKDSAHLLDDLESIRQLLGEDNAQPPLLTDTVTHDGQIPLLFDVVSGKVISVEEHDVNEADIPTLIAEPAQSHAETTATLNPDALLHLDNELRAAARLIMQDVIDDFAPHIENEIKRRLDARMERLLSQYQN
ncbi:DNA polymerase III subunit chi [Pseudomonas huanghezhanensis]|uniref:DNA polymerase III subunit chi n=1 Tax=Pseudomonas huanghezhanensis TaxID=3002903 RepID=UPI002285AA7B|nr:DNA polymerase III subunit chi [Pseudomonas sp. BSw22131]